MVRAFLALLVLSLCATAQTGTFSVPQQEPNGPAYEVVINGPTGGTAKFLRLIWTDRNRRTYGYETWTGSDLGTFGPNVTRAAISMNPDGTNVLFQAQADFPAVLAASFAPPGGYTAFDGIMDFGGSSGATTAIVVHHTFTELIPFQPAMGVRKLSAWFKADGDTGTQFTGGSGQYATQETCFTSATGFYQWIH